MKSGTNLIRDFSEFCEIDHARICRAAGDDDFGLVLLCQGFHFCKVNKMCLGIDAILNGVEPLAGEVGSGPVGQMAAGIEAHAEDGVARFGEAEQHRLVGLRTGARLHIGKTASEKRLRPIDGQLFGNIDILAAAVIAPSWIAFGIFVGKHRAHRFQYGLAHNVLGRDQLDFVLLSAEFLLNGRGKFGVSL